MSQLDNIKLPKVSKEMAENAVRTLLLWINEDPNRDGLIDTPKRVIESYKEFFSGYREDAFKVLDKTFNMIEGYDEMILLKDINIDSHCEHHLVRFSGKAHIAYLPNQKIVGISKLARVAEIYSKRLQIQERLTTEIAQTIHEVLNPLGVAVAIEASHQCISTRGIKKPNSNMVTLKMLGAFKDDHQLKEQFLRATKLAI